MKVLKQDGNEFILECDNDHKEFKFEDKQGGLNCVQRLNMDKGVFDLVAKCPHCQTEWNGRYSNKSKSEDDKYYEIFVVVPEAMQVIANVLQSMTGVNLNRTITLGCVQASNPIEAINNFQKDNNIPPYVMMEGIAAMKSTKEQYELLKKKPSYDFAKHSGK